MTSIMTGSSRMCGEHYFVLFCLCFASGSSPHVRGALVFKNRRLLSVGIIPACAGSTELQNCWRRDTRDHPRMCGEHSFQAGMYESM